MKRASREIVQKEQIADDTPEQINERKTVKLMKKAQDQEVQNEKKFLLKNRLIQPEEEQKLLQRSEKTVFINKTPTKTQQEMAPRTPNFGILSSKSSSVLSKLAENIEKTDNSELVQGFINSKAKEESKPTLQGFTPISYQTPRASQFETKEKLENIILGVNGSEKGIGSIEIIQGLAQQQNSVLLQMRNSIGKIIYQGSLLDFCKWTHPKDEYLKEDRLELQELEINCFNGKDWDKCRVCVSSSQSEVLKEALAKVFNKNQQLKMGNTLEASRDIPCNFSSVTEEELLLLEQRFRRMDTDGSGELEPNEFLNVPELSQNPLVQRVISVFDKNGDGNISFYEFVMGLSRLSSAGRDEDKLRFAFSIYDMNGDGYISNGELFNVLKMMVGNNLNDVQLQQLVDRTIIKADEDFDGKISFSEFCKMVQSLDVANKLTLHF